MSNNRFDESLEYSANKRNRKTRGEQAGPWFKNAIDDSTVANPLERF